MIACRFAGYELEYDGLDQRTRIVESRRAEFTTRCDQ